MNSIHYIYIYHTHRGRTCELQLKGSFVIANKKKWCIATRQFLCHTSPNGDFQEASHFSEGKTHCFLSIVVKLVQ